MYVSPAVRSIRDDPIEGEKVALLLDVAGDGDPEEVAAAAADVGTVEGEREFGTVEVTVPHERVGAVCELSGVAAVETANTLGVGPDGAGEDVRLG